jgi:Uma2 family endonuclease
LYAEAGIREYWVVDLIDHIVRLNSNPQPGTKRYRTTAIARPGEQIAFEAFPTDQMSVEEILGPPRPAGDAGQNR